MAASTGVMVAACCVLAMVMLSAAQSSVNGTQQTTPNTSTNNTNQHPPTSPHPPRNGTEPTTPNPSTNNTNQHPPTSPHPPRNDTSGSYTTPRPSTTTTDNYHYNHTNSYNTTPRNCTTCGHGHHDYTTPNYDNYDPGYPDGGHGHGDGHGHGHGHGHGNGHSLRDVCEHFFGIYGYPGYDDWKWNCILSFIDMLRYEEYYDHDNSWEHSWDHDDDSWYHDSDSWYDEDNSWYSSEDSWYSSEDSWYSSEDSWYSSEDSWYSDVDELESSYMYEPVGIFSNSITREEGSQLNSNNCEEIELQRGDVEYLTPEYGNDVNQCWRIYSAQSNTPVRGRFLHFDIEHNQDCSFDQVIVKGSERGTARSYCGEGAELLPVVNGNSEIKVMFTTDGSVTRGGFEMEITAGCEQLWEDSGVFSSPYNISSSDIQYNNNEYICWDIPARDEAGIVVQIEEYNMENRYDYLKFYSNGERVRQLTGRSSNLVEVSVEPGNALRAKFTTDGSGTRRGFDAYYYYE